MPVVKKYTLLFFLLLSFDLCYGQIYTPANGLSRRNPNYSTGRYIEVGVEKYNTNDNFRKLASSTKRLAIVPISLSILQDDKSSTNQTDLQELAYREAYNARQLLYSFMVAENIKKKGRITLQNIVVTDSILFQHNITSENIKTIDPKKLAAILGVESVMIATVNRKEKLAQPNLILDNVITATLALFRSGVINVSTYDGRDGSITWYYQRDMTEGLGSETNQMFLAIMQRAAIFCPYLKL